MVDKIVVRVALATTLVAGLAAPGNASPFFFSTGNTDGKMAAASRPDSAPTGTPSNEIETGDDFVVPSDTASITSATFIGLLANGATTANIGQVTAQIYRVFPNDSNVGRTSGPPTFSTPQVPTRVNSPSDVEFTDRSTINSNLSFTTTVLSNSFLAANSILPGGIHPMPNQATGGNGSVMGQEVRFNLTFTIPINLPADHYFFVPQVETGNGEFLWLSAPRPIVAPGTQFPPGFTDLQGWTRDAALEPDWLRVGTDIVDTVNVTTAPTFNFTFSLTGDVVPLPATLPLFATGLGALGLLGWRRKRKALEMHQSIIESAE